MTIKKSLLFFLLITAGFHTIAQTRDSTVFLKWKLKPGEVLIYKTVMNEIDIANHKDINMDGMMRGLGETDTAGMAMMKKMMSQLSEEVSKYSLVTQLSERRKGIVDIEMTAVDTSKEPDTFGGKNADDSLKNISKLLSKLSLGVALRGAVYEDGKLESYYIPNGQRNLVSLFFELPGKSIRPGDSWSLPTNLVTFDQNFRCDTSYRKNKVTFTAMEVVNNEHVADIEYDIVDYASGTVTSPFTRESTKSMMKMTYKAIAKFSIERGRWISYNGLMSLSANGIMTSQSTKKFALVIQ